MYDEPTSTVSVALPVNVITGAVPSTTFTVLVTCVAALPAASLTLYVTVYEPTVLASTGLTVTMLAVKSPSTLSLAVAPASVYDVPTGCDTVAFPVNVITGPVMSIVKLGIVTLPALPDSSVTVIVSPLYKPPPKEANVIVLLPTVASVLDVNARLLVIVPALVVEKTKLGVCVFDNSVIGVTISNSGGLLT